MLAESRKIIVLSGMGMIRESGISYFRDEPYAYQIEARYGYSPEDFLSAAFYASRPGSFYKFYKEEVLKLRYDAKPNAAHKALARLEQQKEAEGGRVAIATRSISGLHQKAGCKNVIELCGNLFRNTCTRCGKSFRRNILCSLKEFLTVINVRVQSVREFSLPEKCWTMAW